MKISNKLLLFLVALVFSTSCSIDDPKAFDTETSYIYFNMPFVYSSLGVKTNIRHDSLIYSFAFDDHTVEDYTFNVPIGVIGARNDKDRVFKVEVIEAKTTATDGDWDANSILNATVKKDELFTNLKVKIKRSEILKTDSKYIFLKIAPNENFDEGDRELLEVKLVFSDILKEPKWWSTYRRYFGPFIKEVYVKWREIYPLGADKGLNQSNKEPLYWDNMPPLYIESWYPVLTMKINVLKQYFIENVVYPDGDTSKPRILLPN